MSVIETLTDSEINWLLDFFKKRPRAERGRMKHTRNRCMILLMLDAGFRVGEVVKTRRGSLIFAGEFCNTVSVTADASKTNTQRNIPTTLRLQEALKNMQELVWTPQRIPPDGFAFYAKNFLHHLTVRQIERIVETISHLTLTRAIHPHVLRHTFATRLMRTTNVRVVQELLGHKSLSSTQVYTHPNGQDLSEAIKTLNPKGNENGRSRT